MEEQIVKQINDDISKNPTCECYHLRKYFGDKPLEEYSILRMMETFQDGSIAPGIKDSELVDLLFNRVYSLPISLENQKEIGNILFNLYYTYRKIENNG